MTPREPCATVAQRVSSIWLLPLVRMQQIPWSRRKKEEKPDTISEGITMLKYAIAASCGAGTAVLFSILITMWPATVLSPDTIRLAIGLGVVVSLGALLCRRQDSRHNELMAAVRHGRIADDAEAYLRGKDGMA